MFQREKKTILAEWWWTIDKGLLGALLLLLAMGVLLSFAASPPVAERLGFDSWHFIVRQIMFACLAVPIMLGTSMMPLKWARWSALLTLVVFVAALWLTLRIGVENKGARRWIALFGQTVQPSEFVKPAYAVIAAWLFSEHMQHQNVPAREIAIGVAIAIVGALLLQPDIGQSALMIATLVALLFLSGISWFWIIGLGIAAVGGLFGAYQVFPHFAKRIDSFINPDDGNTYQVDKALNSLLEGGWFGRGPGESLAKKVIPDAHADYVFSAAAGEFGILFCIGLVGLIGFIVVRALLGAQAQQNLFARFAAATLAVQFGLQSGINLAVNLNLIPPKGMTLPFVSYGGTSMLAVAFGMGLMLAFTRKKPEERMRTGLPVYRGSVLSPAE